MKTKKPDIFLGITMCMLVLAVVLCIVIMFVQKSDKDPKPVDPAGTALSTNADPQNSGETQGTGSVDTGTPVTPPVELKAIDEAGLKAALDESLKGLTSEWQVMVIDPAFDTHVSSTVNCSVEDWMTANRMTQVFIMATVFQQSQDGPLVLDEVLDDVKAMMNAMIPMPPIGSRSALATAAPPRDARRSKPLPWRTASSWASTGP